MTGFDVARRRPLSESVAGRCFPTLEPPVRTCLDLRQVTCSLGMLTPSLAVQCESQLKQEQ